MKLINLVQDKEEKMDSPQKTAKIAGLLYLILAITGAYSLMFVSEKIGVAGDAAATAGNILANEFLFRTGSVSHLISATIFIFLVLFLYRLFKPVNEHLAKLMVALVIVQIPISILIEVSKFTSLMILKGNVLKTFEPEQLQDLAWLFRQIYWYGISANKIFWGIWLIPFGLLVYKSKFIPRILGGLLMIASIGYIVESLAYFLIPDFYSFITKFTFIMIFGELPIIFWLLIKGIKVQSKT